MKAEFQNVSKYYGRKCVLNQFTATLEHGVYGLLGPNGAGKTTLINIFIGILQKSSGRLLIDGQDAEKLGTEFLGHIGYLPQYPQFYKNFTAEDFMAYICVLKDIPETVGRQRTEELLEMVNLMEHRRKKIGALSGGMRQRLGIAQAMLNHPDILILDEPTAGLDPQERIRFRSLISQFSAERIVLLATHIVSDVEFIASEVLLLKNGILLKRGRPKELTQAIAGKVWELTLPDPQAAKRFDAMQISNMSRDADGIHLRMVCENCPAEDASPAPPNLEDVFLCYCSDHKMEKTITTPQMALNLLPGTRNDTTNLF